MSLLKRKCNILNDLPSPSFSPGLQQRISLVGEVGPVLIAFYQLREREELLNTTLTSSSAFKSLSGALLPLLILLSLRSVP